MSNRNFVAAIAALSLMAACDARPREVSIPIPNTPAPGKLGQVEQTQFADKVVTSNWTPNALRNCVVFVGEHRGDLERIDAGATVTLMRTRFKPYIEAEAFLAERNRRMECDAPTGRVVVHFPYMGTFTVPAEALKRR